MKNLNKKLVLFLITIVFFYGCGFKPVYNLKNSNFTFSKIKTNGENVSLIIRNELKNYISANENKKNYDIEINLEKKRNTKSKNTKGEALIFSIKIKGDILIYANNVVIKKLNIIKSFDYQNDSNKFNLSEYEKNIENNLISKIINDLILEMADISND